MFKEDKMKLREKIAIILLAAFVTFAGFAAISSSAVEIIKIGKEAGLKEISNVLAEKSTPPVPLS